MQDEERKIIQFKTKAEIKPVSQSSGSAMILSLLFCNGCLRYWSAPFKWTANNQVHKMKEAPVCMICKTNELVEVLKTWEPKMAETIELITGIIIVGLSVWFASELPGFNWQFILTGVAGGILIGFSLSDLR